MSVPSLPITVRALSGVARLAQGLGLPLGSLEAESVLAAARKRTGLEDFGDGFFREPLERLLASLREEAALSGLGRIIARGEIVELLSNRLQLEDWRRRHPEIDAVEVKRPIFVIGMGRTGTTILHDLLAQDPANRVPLSWEVASPCPPPERASYDSDPRIARTDARLAQTDRIIPEFKSMHAMGAQLAQECVSITAHEFTSMIFHCTYHVPGYAKWLHEEADLAPVYAAHRRFLQLLQWRCPRERWVLKSPGHLWAIDDMLAEYPDALLIQTHRDPLRILTSLASLVETLRLMTSGQVDRRAIAREWADHIHTALDHSVDARESGRIDPARVIDIQFDEFTADPFGAIKGIYDRFGLELTGEADARMRAFMASNPRDKHGRHAYRFADNGLDRDEERARTRRYQEYFGVSSEDFD